VTAPFGRRGLTRLAAGIAVVTVAASACSSSSKSSSGGSSGSSASSGSTAASEPNKASAPGITADTITIGSHQPLTGIAAPGYSEIAPSANAYFQWVNDHGGVNGRKIVYKYEDDAYNPANTTAVVRKQVLEDQVFAIFTGLGTATHLAVRDFLNTNKIPDLFVASGCLCWADAAKYPYTFGSQTDYTIEGKIQGQFIDKTYAGKKIGYFYQNDDFGQDGLKGLDSQISASSVVTKQPYTVTNINVGPQIAALQQAGAQVVVSYSVPPFTALALLAAQKLNYHPQWVVSNVGADPTTLTGMLSSYSKGAAGGSLLEGNVSDSYLPPPDDVGNPWIQLFRQVHDKYVPTLPFDGNVQFGMTFAYTFVQTMLAAGKNPTRQSVVDALQKSHFTGPGLVPFRFSPTDHGGYSGEQMNQLTNGKIQTIGPPQVTDGGSGPITPYTTAQPAPPPNGIPTS